jgi:hypothetical protein
LDRAPKPKQDQAKQQKHTHLHARIAAGLDEDSNIPQQRRPEVVELARCAAGCLPRSNNMRL